MAVTRLLSCVTRDAADKGRGSLDWLGSGWNEVYVISHGSQAFLTSVFPRAYENNWTSAQTHTLTSGVSQHHSLQNRDLRGRRTIGPNPFEEPKL